MKLLFVENRFATKIYEAVGRRLEAMGHEIHWLVQNPIFSPKWGYVHKLPFPLNHVQDLSKPDEYAWLRQSDRGVLHFGVSGKHYSHYDHHITAVLDTVMPDVIFGEATAFHELLTIKRARERNIFYLAPNATRYPTDRVVFMSYDTLDAVGGDGSFLNLEKAERILEAIRTRKVVPSYMRMLSNPSWSIEKYRLVSAISITKGWFAGERYITPSPVRKFQLSMDQRRQRKYWDDRASNELKALSDLLHSRKPWVLYALQMQPESNIDVFGAPWNEQAEIIRRAAQALQKNGAMLVVKPNPKSKYEMTKYLNDVMDGEPNLVRVSHSTPMSDLFPHAPLILTVTGTVLLESIFIGKPVACLGTHSMRNYPGVTPIEAPEDVSMVLANVMDGHACSASHVQALALLQRLHATSYSATIWDPVRQPHQGTDATIDALTTAFASVLKELK